MPAENYLEIGNRLPYRKNSFQSFFGNFLCLDGTPVDPLINAPRHAAEGSHLSSLHDRPRDDLERPHVPWRQEQGRERNRSRSRGGSPAKVGGAIIRSSRLLLLWLRSHMISSTCFGLSAPRISLASLENLRSLGRES